MGAAEQYKIYEAANEVTPTDSGIHDVIDGFFAPVQFDLISSLIQARNADKARIENLAQQMAEPDAAQVLHHFILGNKPDQKYTMDSHIGGLFEPAGAISHLDSQYWQRALKLTDVLDYMPQQRRSDWFDQIQNPKGVLKRGSQDEYEIPPIPAFEEDTVRATLISLLNSRAQFFAERVDGIFRALSRTHVTNQPEGFGKRFILPRVVMDYGGTDWRTCGFIDDLRCVIAKFIGRDEPNHGSTHAALEHIRRSNGVWHDMDGGAIRIRIYNGVGTAHIEVHEEMAWRLNGVLAMLYPAAIPAKNRTRRTRKAKSLKKFELMDRLLPFAVIDALVKMKPAIEPFAYGLQKRYRDIPNTLYFQSGAPDDKAVTNQVEDILAAIGGVRENHYWRFSYDPGDVIGEIVCSGAVPDHISHQFYPTPETLAQEAVAIAAQEAPEGALWLEPSAGTGNIAKLIPEPSRLHCIEVSELHTKILQAHGFENVIHGDFLELAGQMKERFNRIVMNPPYSQGRWQAHLEAAANLLAEDGRLVAIIPASANGKNLLPGFNHTYTEVYANRFSGTSMAVVILELSKA